jgi:cytochrome c oxidase assembly factor 6
MGLFGTSTTKSTEPETKIAPNRSQRAKCWEARDAFFECLDRNSIIDSVKEDKKAKEVCGGENVKFEKECVASWVRTSLPWGIGPAMFRQSCSGVACGEPVLE